MSNNKKKFKVNITITGDGQEFVQGIIDNKTYQQIKDKAHNDCKSIEATWQEETGFFAEKTLDLEDWYEYNEKAHKWGTFLENTQISIEIDGENIIENKLIFDDVKYADNPDDKFVDIGDLNGLCTKDDQNGCLITTIVQETGFFSTLDFEIDPFRKKCLLEGLDDIALTLKKIEKIDLFEKNLNKSQSWIV